MVRYLVTGILTLFLLSCIGLAPVKNFPPGPVDSHEVSAADEGILALLAAGDASLAGNDIQLALQQYAGALQRAETESPALIEDCRSRIREVENRIALEPGNRWLSPEGLLISPVFIPGESPDVMPEVFLSYQNEGIRVPLERVSIRFSIVKGSGDIVEVATTGGFGTASAPMTTAAAEDGRLEIQAVPVLRLSGWEFPLSRLAVNLAYDVRKSVAALAFTRKQPDMPWSDSSPDFLSSTDPLVRNLSQAGIRVSSIPVPDSSRPDPLDAMIASADDASILLAVTVDSGPPEQVVVQGKSYNIYTVQAKVSIRLLSLPSRKVLSGFPVLQVKAQGGSPERAMQDSRNAVLVRLTEFFNENAESIMELISGEEGGTRK